jgi:hypothetical protein
MKKVLLSLSVLAASFAANAQSVNVGSGAYDDFAMFGNSADNPTGEYNYQFGEQTAGIFWWKDAANSSDYALTRSGGELSVAVNKGTAYSPFGFGFGDDNGAAAGGNPFYIDMSSAKTITIKVKATLGTSAAYPSFYLQVKDANGISGEIRPGTATAGDAAKYGVTALTAAYQTLTYDITGMLGQTVPSTSPSYVAASHNMWTCTNYPTDCPDRTRATEIDFTKIVEVSFFVNGGAAWNGTVTFDEVKIGKSANLGLGTASVAANISSSVVFPNPASDAVYANLNLKSANNVTVIVTDLMGRQVATKAFGRVSEINNAEIFNAASLAKGMYTVTYVLDGTPAKSDLVVVK